MTKGEKQCHVYITNKKVISAIDDYISDTRKNEHAAFTLKARLVGARSYSGRRTFITRLIEQAAEIKAVSRLAGHTQIASAVEYVENDPERLKRISNLVVF